MPITFSEPARLRRWAARTVLLAPPAHSGQRTPTAASRMQDVQMGRSQLEQESSVSRSGWR